MRDIIQQDNTFITRSVRLDDIDFEMCIHRANTNRVLIMYPGADGSIDGYNSKYEKIANLLQSNNIAFVVRIDNRYCCGKLPYVEMMIVKLAFIIENIYENAKEYFGHDNIELCLAGVSAGAGAIATILDEFRDIKKVLLIAPADGVGIDNMRRGLKNYSGELYLIAGQEDEIEAGEVAQYLFENSEAAAKRLIKIIPNCDHYFSGKKNGQNLANSFIWAFGESDEFLRDKDGIVLYE